MTGRQKLKVSQLCLAVGTLQTQQSAIWSKSTKSFLEFKSNTNIPSQLNQGILMNIETVFVHSGYYQAYVVGETDKKKWEQGRSEAEAVGKLMLKLSNSGSLEIKITSKS